MLHKSDRTHFNLLQTNRQLLNEIACSANIIEKLQLAPEDSCLKHVVRDQLSTVDSFAEMTDYLTWCNLIEVQVTVKKTIPDRRNNAQLISTTKCNNGKQKQTGDIQTDWLNYELETDESSLVAVFISKIWCKRKCIAAYAVLHIIIIMTSVLFYICPHLLFTQSSLFTKEKMCIVSVSGLQFSMHRLIFTHRDCVNILFLSLTD